MYPKIAKKGLSEADITDKLENPPPTAQDAGMPTVPATNPDLKALVAFVKSLAISAHGQAPELVATLGCKL